MVPDQPATTIVQNVSDVSKSETFTYTTEISAATWSFNKIVPVSIALARWI